MGTENFLLGKSSIMKLGFLVNIAAIILGIAAPVLSQPYGQPQLVPSGGQPVPNPGQPQLVPSGGQPVPNPGQPQLVPSGGQPQLVPSGGQTQIIAPNINELVTRFGLVPTNCTIGVATIRQDQNVVCVNPTPSFPAGDYIYDPVSNRFNPVKVNPQFSFVNSLQYSRCVEDVLTLYQDKERLRQQGRQSDCFADTFQANMDRGISRTQAREMIESVNLYATLLIKPKLFPPRGLREQVAQQLGFIYEIDANDPTIRQMATQGTASPAN